MNNSYDEKLTELLKKHAVANGEDTETPTKELHNEETSDLVMDIAIEPEESNTTEEDVVDYGDDDLEEEIKAEDELREKKLREELANKPKEETPIFMPPDDRDMSYHEEAIDFQTNKMAILTTMINKVVAKHHIVSGEVPEMREVVNAKTGQHYVITKRMVIGELMAIYEESGETITPKFEEIILKNWIMPDGTTTAYESMNESGDVVDKSSTNNTDVSQNDTIDGNDSEDNNKESTPTINITVKENTPLTINVDKELSSTLQKNKEVNIYVKEISESEMMAMEVIENSDLKGVITPYDAGLTDVPLTLPLSAYRCTMRSVNWFDFIKLTTSPSSGKISDAELKKWTVIFKHVKNASIGEFKAFERDGIKYSEFDDFLMKTKYQDRELLMWGILVATADPEEELHFKCNNPKCGHHISTKYIPKNLLHYSDDVLPKYFKDVEDAPAGDVAVDVWNKNANKHKFYKLPKTGITVEISEPSAYEYINNKLVIVQNLYKRYNPEGTLADEKEIDQDKYAEFQIMSSMALAITSMNITKDGKMYRYTNWDDIERIITTSLDSSDSGLLIRLIEKTIGTTPMTFYLENIKCPYCGKVYEKFPIADISDSLLFQLSQRLSNTAINLIDMESN